MIKASIIRRSQKIKKEKGEKKPKATVTKKLADWGKDAGRSESKSSTTKQLKSTLEDWSAPDSPEDNLPVRSSSRSSVTATVVKKKPTKQNDATKARLVPDENGRILPGIREKDQTEDFSDEDDPFADRGEIVMVKKRLVPDENGRIMIGVDSVKSQDFKLHRRTDYRLVKFYRILQSSQQYYTIGALEQTTIGEVVQVVGRHLGGEWKVYELQDGERPKLLALDVNLLERQSEWSVDCKLLLVGTGEIGESAIDPRERLIPKTWKQLTDVPASVVPSPAAEFDDDLPIFVAAMDTPEARVVNFQELRFVKKLSSGSFAKVYKGKWLNASVAIKVLKGDITFDALHSFQKEWKVMLSADSPYLVRFFGACTDRKLCMIMEYCKLGSLYDYMRSQKRSRRITWQDGLRWLKHATLGLQVRYFLFIAQALHRGNPPLVHRDIKSHNMLLTTWNGRIGLKLCDFGLSRFHSRSNLGTLSQLRGTMAYTAPECAVGEIFTTKSDIYSLAIVMWELVARIQTGKYAQPFSEYSEITADFQIVLAANNKGLRPTIPEHCPDSFSGLIRRCWSGKQEERPDCERLKTLITFLEAEYTAAPEVWDEFMA